MLDISKATDEHGAVLEPTGEMTDRVVKWVVATSRLPLAEANFFLFEVRPNRSPVRYASGVDMHVWPSLVYSTSNVNGKAQATLLVEFFTWWSQVRARTDPPSRGLGYVNVGKRRD